MQLRCRDSACFAQTGAFERDFNKNGAYMGIYYSYKGNPSTEALSEGTIEKWPSSVWSISDCHAIVL